VLRDSRDCCDHAHQVRSAHCSTRPDLRHVCLPDLIWLSCFHAAHFSSVARTDDASAPATHVLASPATLALRFTRSLFFRQMETPCSFLVRQKSGSGKQTSLTEAPTRTVGGGRAVFFHIPSKLHPDRIPAKTRKAPIFCPCSRTPG